MMLPGHREEHDAQTENHSEEQEPWDWGPEGTLSPQVVIMAVSKPQCPSASLGCSPSCV